MKYCLSAARVFCQNECNVFHVVPLTNLCVSSEVVERELSPSSSQEVAEAEGFGKLYPSAQASQQQEEHSDEEQDLPSDVISRKELEKGRLSRDGKHDLFKRRGESVVSTVHLQQGRLLVQTMGPLWVEFACFPHFCVGLLGASIYSHPKYMDVSRESDIIGREVKKTDFKILVFKTEKKNIEIEIPLSQQLKCNTTNQKNKKIMVIELQEAIHG